MGDTFQLEEELLWSLVRKFVRQSKVKLTLYDENDLFSEARATAAFAVKSYQHDKNCKIRTYVYKCVQNKLLDMMRAESRQTETVLTETGELPEIPVEDMTIQDREFVLTMQTVLSEKEFKVFHLRYVQDYTVPEIAEVFKMTTRGVNKCLMLVRQKYLLIEKTQDQILTRRKLGTKWLASSETSQNELSLKTY